MLPAYRPNFAGFAPTTKNVGQACSKLSSPAWVTLFAMQLCKNCFYLETSNLVTGTAKPNKRKPWFLFLSNASTSGNLLTNPNNPIILQTQSLATPCCSQNVEQYSTSQPVFHYGNTWFESWGRLTIDGGDKFLRNAVSVSTQQIINKCMHSIIIYLYADVSRRQVYNLICPSSGL